MDVDAITEAIKVLEPALRAKGKAIDWSLFDQWLYSGGFVPLLATNDEQVAKAVAKYEAFEGDDLCPQQEC